MHGMSCHWSSALTVRPPEKPVAFAPLTFTCSSTCFTYNPLAISCAPFLHMARSSRSPLLSMNVTSLRSIMQARLSSLRCALFQVVLSSLTHGPTKRPCTIHLLSVAVSVMVIFSTSTSQGCQNETSCSAPCQPQPVAHGLKQSKSFAVAQDAVPPVPLTGENQNRSHSASPLICVPFGRHWERQHECQNLRRFGNNGSP